MPVEFDQVPDLISIGKEQIPDPPPPHPPTHSPHERTEYERPQQARNTLSLSLALSLSLSLPLCLSRICGEEEEERGIGGGTYYHLGLSGGSAITSRRNDNANDE